MKSTWLAAAITLLVLAAPAAQAIDLTKVDRTIAKEPAYETKTPKYCLLVFGPEAKAHAWLVLDGTTLYVDRNCNGDLTGRDKRVQVKTRRNSFDGFEAGTITEPDGKTRHTGLAVGVYYGEQAVTQQVSIKVESKDDWYNVGSLRFADRPSEAPIIHFGGPLTLRAFGIPPRNPLGFVPGKERSFWVYVGTPGLGSFARHPMKARDVPAEARPTAEIQFPSSIAGDKPIMVRVVLEPDG